MLQIKFYQKTIHLVKNKNTDEINEQRLLQELQETGINLFTTDGGYTFLEYGYNLYSGGGGDFYPYMIEQLVMKLNRDKKFVLPMIPKREQKVFMQ